MWVTVSVAAIFYTMMHACNPDTAQIKVAHKAGQCFAVFNGAATLMPCPPEAK